jgi:ABC-type polysaccharide/polyol phosphate export permease
MRLLLHLVAKDLRRKRRSPLGLIAALCFPLLFAGMIALAFGRGDGVPRVRMLVANEDDGLLAGGVASVFTSQQASKYFDGKTVTEAQGRALMDAGKASALLTIPKGFTRDVLDGKPVTLRLLRNPSEGILPEIAEQTAGALTDVLDGGRRVFSKPIDDLRPLLEDDGKAPSDADVVAISLAVKREIEGMSGIVLPPAISLESELFDNVSSKPGPAKPNDAAPSAIFLLVLPGVAVYGLFLVADQGMRDIMTERTLGTLRRQLAGPVRPELVILGKATFTAILAASAIVVLAAVGAAALRARVSVSAFVLVSGALVLAVTGTTSMVYGLARTERQASTLGNMLFLMMGFLGGGFIRVEGLPAVVRSIAPFTPLYWGTQGYRRLLENGAGVSGIATHAAVLAAMGLLFLGIGAAALRRSAREGAGA